MCDIFQPLTIILCSMLWKFTILDFPLSYDCFSLYFGLDRMSWVLKVCDRRFIVVGTLKRSIIDFLSSLFKRKGKLYNQKKTKNRYKSENNNVKD